MAKIVEVINPVTGQPTQVDQLDHTAQQIDDAISRALPGGYYDKWVSQLPGQNLLDNSVFLPGCLVDQRQGRVVIPNTTYYSDNQLTTAAGTTSAYVTAYLHATGTASGVNYASFKLTDTDAAPTYYAAPENVVRGYTGAGYGTDRWIKESAGTVLISETGLKLVSQGEFVSIDQPFEHVGNIIGRTVTVSALFSDGQLYCKTETLDSDKSLGNSHNYGFYFYESYRGGCFRIFCSVETDIEIKASFLDLGDHQKHFYQDENGVWQLNELPNYADTLARCQRYFRRIRRSYLRLAHVASGVGRVSIPLDGMRDANPSIKFVVTPNVYAYNSWGPLAGASVSASATTADGSTNIVLEVTGSSALTTTDYVINNVCLDVINDL